MLRKLAIILTAVLLLSACGGAAKPAGTPSTTPAAGGAPKVGALTIKFAHAASKTHPYGIGAPKFKELVEQRSGGAIKVSIYGDAQLGGEKEVIEAVKGGTIQMTVVAADGALPNWVPELNALGLPFIVRDRDHAYKLFDGPVGKEFGQKLDAQGLHPLAWWELGFRNLTTKDKPVKTPADVKGLKIRVQESKVWIAFMKSLGATPVPIAFNELYLALQQGVVDGQENPFSSIVASRFYEVQKYISLTGHTYTALPVLVSKKWWDTLSPEQQKIIADAALEAQTYQRQTVAAQETDNIKLLKDKGITILDVDKAAFADATKDVYKAIADQVPADLVQRIRDTK